MDLETYNPILIDPSDHDPQRLLFAVNSLPTFSGPHALRDLGGATVGLTAT